MNKVEFLNKTVFFLVRPETYWVICYLAAFTISYHVEVQLGLLHRPRKKSGMNFTCEYTTPMDFEPLNANPVSEFPLDRPIFP